MALVVKLQKEICLLITSSPRATFTSFDPTMDNILNIYSSEGLNYLFVHKCHQSLKFGHGWKQLYWTCGYVSVLLSDQSMLVKVTVNSLYGPNPNLNRNLIYHWQCGEGVGNLFGDRCVQEIRQAYNTDIEEEIA